MGNGCPGRTASTPPASASSLESERRRLVSPLDPMSLGLLAQYLINGMMLGMMYALVAVGFTLFFGVLDVIQFSHGDLVTGGAFAGLAVYLALGRVVESTV